MHDPGFIALIVFPPFQQFFFVDMSFFSVPIFVILIFDLCSN